MITGKLTDHLSTRISDAFQLNSIYRPVTWRAKDVLTERKKAALRKRNQSIVLWLITTVAFVVMLVLISGIKDRVPAPAIVSPKTVVHSGNQAYSRGDFLKAQEAYRNAIQSGYGTNEVWMNYDRALIMQTIKELESNPSMIQPANSIRIEQGVQPQPVKATPNQNYMSDEEWEQLRQNAYEWLGC